MKRIAILAGLFGFALTGCATTGGTGGTSQIIGEVQAIAQQVCSFQPTISTIVSIIGLAVPGLSTADQIAHAICQVVGTPGNLKLSRHSPTIHGVAVKGHFIH